MKKLFFLFLASFLLITVSQAQFTRYEVKLKNKGGTPHTLANPTTYLSQRAIDRRTKYNIAIDSTDLPVSPSYVSQIAGVSGVTILNRSKWLNSVSIQTSDPNAITTISGFPFVESVSGLAARQTTEGRNNGREKFEPEETLPPATMNRNEGTSADYFDYGTNSFNEIHLHNGEFLHNIGLRGQTMQVAVLDAGFFNYTSLKAFDSANANGQILDTWDFVSRHSSVTEDHTHGMQCLSTIVANIPGQFVGKAPKASFYLFRTEDVFSEYRIEEHNWVCGAERADSAGADIISSSLGYYDFDNASLNYTYTDMDGNTTIAVKGADMAATKGMMVFNSAGNEGNNGWHFLITPSDGDSVVAVGAVNSAGAVGSFSSYGPSADGRIKPDMASVGVAALIQSSNNNVGAASGTSFACPNMAGLATCLWQGFPEFNNMKIITALKQAGHIYTTPDDRTGYGIPDMKKAFASLLKEFATASADISSCSANIQWSSKDVSAMKYEIERKLPGDTGFLKVGEVNPQAGNILANHSYQFDHSLSGLAPGTISYRIRQVIDTATASFTALYIDTVEVNLAATCTDGSAAKPTVYVQPNPTAESTVTLVVNTADAINTMPVLIYDGNGRLLSSLKYSKGAGVFTYQLPISTLASGKYYIKVLDGNKTVGTAELIRL